MSLLGDTWNDWTQRGTLLTSSCYACTRIHCFTAGNMGNWAQVVRKEGSLLTAGCIEQPLRKSFKFAPVVTLQQPLSITVIWANTKLAAFRGEQMVISTANTLKESKWASARRSLLWSPTTYDIEHCLTILHLVTLKHDWFSCVFAKKRLSYRSESAHADIYRVHLL